ncbi:hypothetical protein YC2023_016785 [Brassica napus]
MVVGLSVEVSVVSLRNCLEFPFQSFVPTPSCSEKILLLVVEGFNLVSRSFLASVATCPVGVAVALAISFPNKELDTANGLLWFEMLEGSSLRLVVVVYLRTFPAKLWCFFIVAGLMCKAVAFVVVAGLMWLYQFVLFQRGYGESYCG